MRINHSTQNSFKGMYIVKGNGRQVSKVVREVCSRTSDPTQMNFLLKMGDVTRLDNKIEPLKNFTCTAEMLTGFFSEKQPVVEVLFMTNEHSGLIADYYKRKLGILDEKEMDDVHITIFNNRLQKFLKENTDNFKEYSSAMKKCLEEGDSAQLAKFIVKRAVEAKKKLAEITTLAQIDTEINVLRAENVLKAIENNSFEFNNGEINYLR